MRSHVEIETSALEWDFQTQAGLLRWRMGCPWVNGFWGTASVASGWPVHLVQDGAHCGTIRKLRRKQYDTAAPGLGARKKRDNQALYGYLRLPNLPACAAGGLAPQTWQED